MSPIPADYVDVAERIREFRAQYPDGSLQAIAEPRVLSVGGKDFIVYAAAAYRTPDDKRPGIGYAWEPVPGPTPFTRDSELMNAETSAWGRAIVALGFPTKKIASADEVRNRQTAEPEGPKATQAQHAKHNAMLAELAAKDPPADTARSWTEEAQIYVKAKTGKHSRSQLTVDEMGDLIEWTQKHLDRVSVPFGDEAAA